MGTKGTLAILGGEPAVPAHAHRKWPDITDDDRRAVLGVLDRQIWGVRGPERLRLEEEFARYCEARYCLAVNTGTAALRCAVTACGVGPGDEVIIPAFTFVASAMAGMLGGATPVFCDVSPRTFTIDPSRVERLITNRTKAVMPVYIQGLAADSTTIDEIARRHGIAVIADAAQAAGATDNGRKAGALATCSTFSLNGQKPFQAGEGGLLTCNDPDVVLAAGRFARLGQDKPALKPHEEWSDCSSWVGEQYRMPEMTAALARSQLRRLDDYLRRARENAALLTAGLAPLPGFAPPSIPTGCQSSFYRFRIRLDPRSYGWDGPATEYRDRVVLALRAEGALSVGWWQRHPIPAHPVFRTDSPRPWSPGIPSPELQPWHAAAFPETSRLLAETITVGEDPYELYVQDARLMRSYITAFEKAAANMSAILTMPFDAPRFVPATPVDLR